MAALTGCATVALPTGGEKDEIPPKLLATNPLQKSVNNGPVSQIELTFDEEVDAGQLSDRLVITPRHPGINLVTTKRNKVIIKLQNPLRPNTTYQIVPRDGIKDLTEGNVPQNVALVFSTGPQLDTLQLGGTLLQAATNQPAEGWTVAASTEAADSLLKKPASYFGFSQVDGRFTIANLPPGNYRVFAFQDKNKNLQYDNRQEPLAYQSQSATLAEGVSDTSLTMRGSFHDSEVPKLITQQEGIGHIKLVLNKGVESIRIDSGAKAGIYLINDGKDVQVRGLTNKDSTRLRFLATDSSGNTATIRALLPIPTKPDTSKAQAAYKAEPSDKGGLSLQAGVTLTFREPVVRFDTAAIRVLPDSQPTKVRARMTWSADNRTFNIATTQARKRLFVMWSANAIQLASGQTLPADTLAYTVMQDSEGGIINVRVSPKPAGNFQVELLNESFKVQKTIRNTTAFAFRDVLPGTYYLRLVDDANNNGRWDGGNYRLNQQPEHVFLRKESILIKANFEIEEISLGF